MNKSKKQLLLFFLIIYLIVEAFFLLGYIYHNISGGPPEALMYNGMMSDIFLKLLIGFGIIAPIALVIWMYLRGKK